MNKQRFPGNMKVSASPEKEKMNGNGDLNLKDDEFDSFDGAMSGDDKEEEEAPRKKKSKYHRHTSYQIQELESFFGECPHPNEKQRLELGRKLRLESTQIKFWFQNRRTQMKTQLERHENVILRQENEKLRVENRYLKEAMRVPICTDCTGEVTPCEVSYEHQLKIENTKLKEELDKICTLTNRYIGSQNLPVRPDFNGGSVMCESSMLMELAVKAMDELIKLADPGFVIVPECSRETGLVAISSLDLVETLMETKQWTEMFDCIVAVASTVEVISNGSNGSRSGSLQLMQAELQVMSPLVPIREVKFLRHCKHLKEGFWAVVDVSYDVKKEDEKGCTRLPSGCIIQDMGNGCSKVTWVEQSEYDESCVHPLYRTLLGSGVGLGATRWLATLQRECQSFTTLLSCLNSVQDHSGFLMSPAGTKSILKLAKRMTLNFYSGITASSSRRWEKLLAENVGEDTRILTRKNIDDPGEPYGVVLSAATSLWLPVSQQRLFDFLRDEKRRHHWDILCNGALMEDMLLVPKGERDGSCCVSLLRPAGKDKTENSMLILQETWIDTSGALVVYAPVDVSSMNSVMNGGDTASVALLPSGFSILPDGSSTSDQISINGDLVYPESKGNSSGGCLLTVGFQILVNSLPTAKLNLDSLDTVNNLISCTIHKIRSALHVTDQQASF